MSTTLILLCAWTALGMGVTFFVAAVGTTSTAATKYLTIWNESHDIYKSGYDKGKEVGYTKGRAEGYEDGRRYEAITHHTQLELEKLLEKETKQ